ncbi:MAG: hypothetical protein ACO3RB_07105 [Ilumatobacteraceae bacterium]
MGASTGPRVVTLAVTWAVVRRPSLWITAVRQVARLAPHRWWATKPFAPVPSREFMEFRLVTQYGGGHGEPLSAAQPGDIVDYLRWCKEWDRTVGR